MKPYVLNTLGTISSAYLPIGAVIISPEIFDVVLLPKQRARYTAYTNKQVNYC